MELLTITKSKKFVIAGIIILAIAILSVIVFFTVEAYATEDYWGIKIGEKTIAVVNTESSAQSVIEGIKNNYVKEGSKVLSIACDPELTYEQQTYKNSDRPEIMETKEAIEYILTGTKEPITYKVKSGDTLWTIADKHGFSVEELENMNGNSDLSVIFPDDIIKLYQVKPFVIVTTEQTVTSEKKIDYKTVKKSSSDILKNMTVVTQSGSQGRKIVTENISTENDQVVKSNIIKTDVTKEAKNKIIVSGTGIKKAPTSGNTYDGNGSSVANYALQYIGNPYVYGGESLTGGADCSGFVLSVYKHFGVSMAHDAGVMRNYGKSVSLSQAQAGDLVCYYGHVGIYIGGGNIVHAVNEGMGIAVTNVGYIGPVVTVRRIVE